MANPNGNPNMIANYGLDKITTEEQLKIASMGGKASGEARARKKSLREKAQLLMSLSIQDEKDKEKLKQLGIDEENMDNDMMNLVHMLNIIKKENFNSVGAFNSIKDLVEDKEEQVSTPKLQIEIVNNEDLEKALYEDK